MSFRSYVSSVLQHFTMELKCYIMSERWEHMDSMIYDPLEDYVNKRKRNLNWMRFH